MATQLNKEVLNTLRYAKFFDYPLTDIELHYWLISPKQYQLTAISGNFHQSLSNQEKKILEARHFQAFLKRKQAEKVVQLIKIIPTVKLIAITGSLAVNNAKPEDDIDLMIITSKDTLWFTRPIVTLLVSLFFKRRHPKTIISIKKDDFSNSVCLNLWLDESSYTIPSGKRNLYTAHEVLQILPIYDNTGSYYKFIESNSWTRKYLANAYHSIISGSKISGIPLEREPLLSPNYISAINKLAFKLQYWYMKKRITRETITLHSAFFHPRNLASEIDHLFHQLK